MKARVLVIGASLAAAATAVVYVLYAGIDTRLAGEGVGMRGPEAVSTVVLLLTAAVALLLATLPEKWPCTALGQFVSVGGVGGLGVASAGHSIPALPSVHESVALAFLGAAIALVATERRRPTTIGHALALVPMVVGTIVIIAFLYDTNPLDCRSMKYGTSPLPALVLVLLGFGTLATNPGLSFVRVFYTSTEGGRLARRFMPYVFIAALLVAIAGAVGLRAGWYTGELGMAILAFTFLLVLGAVTWRYALSVHTAEGRLERLVRRRTRRLSESITEIEEFSQALAHDVRGPMINLREFLGIVLSDHGGELSEEARDYLERAGRASRRVDFLTSAMLRYGELSRRRFRFASVDPAPLLARVGEEVRQSLKVDATITVEGKLVPVWADELGLADIFRELLGNACRFTRPGETPRITISCREQPRAVRVLVRDEGIGVKTEFQQRIFRPFEQLVRSQDNPGIGLALAKRAVTKMNGRIGVVSNGVSGSVFWIELPLPDKRAGRARGSDATPAEQQ